MSVRRPRFTARRIACVLSLTLLGFALSACGGGGSSSSGGSGGTTTTPGTPTLSGATAGSGSIELTFTAPSSDGGSAITGYTATCTADGNTDFSATGTASPITVTGMNGGVTRSCTVAATNKI